MNTKPRKTKEKTDLILLRLKRIEGQIKAIKMMYEEKIDCDKIIQQIIAVREALAGVAKLLLKNKAVKCLKKPKDFEKSIERIIKFT